MKYFLFVLFCVSCFLSWNGESSALEQDVPEGASAAEISPPKQRVKKSDDDQPAEAAAERAIHPDPRDLEWLERHAATHGAQMVGSAGPGEELVVDLPYPMSLENFLEMQYGKLKYVSEDVAVLILRARVKFVLPITPPDSPQSTRLPTAKELEGDVAKHEGSGPFFDSLNKRLIRLRKLVLEGILLDYPLLLILAAKLSELPALQEVVLDGLIPGSPILANKCLFPALAELRKLVKISWRNMPFGKDPIDWERTATETDAQGEEVKTKVVSFHGSPWEYFMHEILMPRQNTLTGVDVGGSFLLPVKIAEPTVPDHPVAPDHQNKEAVKQYIKELRLLPEVLGEHADQCRRYGDFEGKVQKYQEELKQFLAFLKEMPKLNSIGLADVTFDGGNANTLARMLKHWRTRQLSLDLSGVFKGVDISGDLLRAFQVSAQLKGLRLDNNGFGPKSIGSLVPVVSELKTLERLSLAGNNIFVRPEPKASEGVLHHISHMGKILDSVSSKLQELSLARNGMTFADLKAMPDSNNALWEHISRMPHLVKLDLEGNGLTESALAVLKRMLQKMPTLEEIILSKNPFKPVDMAIFQEEAKAIRSASHFNSVKIVFESE